MSLIVDPTNDNVAILDGEIVGAIRWLPTPKDPTAPRVSELQGGTIIGYGPMSWTTN